MPDPQQPVQPVQQPAALPPAPPAALPASNDVAWQQSLNETQGVQPAPPVQQPAAAPPAPVEPPSTALRDAFASRYDPNVAQYFNDDDQLLDAFNTMWEQAQNAPDPATVQNFQQFQPLVAEYAEHAPKFREWLAEQQPGMVPGQAPAAQPEAPAWQAPKLSAKAEQILSTPNLVGRTQDGSIGIYDAVSGEYLQHPVHAAELREIDTFMRHEADVHRRMAADPVGTIWEAGLEQRIKGMLPNMDEFGQQLAQSVLAQVNHLAQQGQVHNQLASQTQLFFETGEDGQVVQRLNPQTRQMEYVTTPLGQAYQAAARDAVDTFGIDPNDQQRLHAFAMRDIRHMLPEAGTQQPAQQVPGQPAPPAPVAAPQTPAAQRVANQQTFLGQADSNGSRFDQPPIQTVSAAAAASQRPVQTNEDVWREAVEEELNASP